LKIIISGYGKMGKEVEKMALQKGHEILLVIDNEEDWKTNAHKIKYADVAVDFSMPATAVENIIKFLEAGIPVVSGTTGWNDKFEEVKNICLAKKQTLFFAPNFSIGVNILFTMNKKLAELMKNFPQYDMHVEETHHTQKLDSPSGTAIALANDLISINERKNKWVNTPSAFNNFLEIKSIREGNICGVHDVIYTSDSDTIELKHIAKNRSGLATGALMAAEWVIGKKGVFGMNDLLNL
jgi:4-hydroxy-tetrahydrodipicolinate reductase